MRMLVSVRNVSEALEAAVAGADFIDIKEPSAGALGGVPSAEVRAICSALAEFRRGFTISATIGDVPAEELGTILRRTSEVGACGVDLVKVGVPGRGAAALHVLDALTRLPIAVVPVLLADDGLDADNIAAACSPAFAAVMADTQHKLAGSLFDVVGNEVLAALVVRARASNVPVGLAGALRIPDLRRLAGLAPDFAGFRSAVCDGPRNGCLDGAMIVMLKAALRDALAEETVRATAGSTACIG